MLLIRVIWKIFDAATDVEHLGNVNYNSDTDMQDAGTAKSKG